MCVCVCVLYVCVYMLYVCTLKKEEKRETAWARRKGAYACVCAVIGVIGAVGGVERQGVVAVEGKCRLVIGLC